ncbi:MAG: PSD1 and planctomycete cytochrome C domain-containing protein [Acidobacteria bacterium]|nr:PSD1 and planctomycete cytochrome C domain-containing protein [Acidobacteriota bacterium]
MIAGTMPGCSQRTGSAVVAGPAILLALLFAASGGAQTAQTPADGIKLFEENVWPVLEQNCFMCHSDPERAENGLLLTTRAGLLRGGERGPAVSTSEPALSLLLHAIAYEDEQLQMPPPGRLAEADLEVIRQWVLLGAPFGGDEDELTEVAPAEDAFEITDADREWWSVRPLVRPDVPAVADSDWPLSPIDHFLLAKLEAAGLEPPPPADRRALIRRASYDLTGLPPTLQEVEAFEQDQRPDAWERLIDRLLASPHYGERWGRHWLDLVRYAETDGYERDRKKPSAWRYRDWVIDALNADMPYDEFLTHQLAGDELDNPTAASVIATGYLRLGIWDDEPTDTELAQYDDLDSVLDTTSRVMLGMSIGCARCHNHRGDPIPQTDYYRMLSFFRGIAPYKVGGGNEPTPENYTDWIPADLGTAEAGGPPVEGPPANLIDVLRVKELGPEAPPTHVLIRGNPHAPAERVEPGFPLILGDADPGFEPRSPDSPTTGRRLALARWIAADGNLRTSRVMANRLWQYHFGRGLSPTPNDLGRFGEPATHPELLDWLATEFTARDWSLKSMHRLLMTSRAYQMSSRPPEGSLEVDPGNDLFSRFNMRRLAAEEIRDSVLAATGTLNLEVGGPSVYPPMPAEVLATASQPDKAWGEATPDEAARRSIYIHVKRSLLHPLLESLDLADTDSTCPVRFTTTQPTQALMMLNGDFMSKQARALAARIEGADGTVEDRVTEALEAVLARRAERVEVARGVGLIEELEREEGFEPEAAFASYSLLLLNLNEFAYLD